MSAIEALPEIVSPLPSAAAPELHAEFLFALERRRPQLLRLAAGITRHPDDAEDILQESVLKALRFLPRFRGDARIDTWLHAIVANTARDWARFRRDHPHTPLESEPGEGGDTLTLDFPHACEDPEQSCSRHEMVRLLRAEIRALDPRYQLPIRLCDLDGRTYREAARILQLSGPAIKAKLFRGRVLLRRRLALHLRLEDDLSRPPRRLKSRPAACSPAVLPRTTAPLNRAERSSAPR
ncbi:MAG: RNA polymerase sigma factor [Acidobacteriaceae bacterium]